MKKLLAYFTLIASQSMADEAYMEINHIHPGQSRYSSQNVREKIEHRLRLGVPGVLSLGDALPVVKTAFGHVLVDGHHDVLASLALGANIIPVKIVADLSALSEEAFWDEAEKRGMAYLYDIQGNRKIPPRDFFQLQDDPNRFFAAISARKYPKSEDLKYCTGAEYPLWIKIGKDIPFIEFQIADALSKNAMIYKYEMGLDPPEEFVEKARQILIQAKIPGLRVVFRRMHYTEISPSFWSSE